MASLLVPVLYVVIVFGSLFLFSAYYRRRNATKVLEPFFPRHVERDIYVTLLQRTDPPTPEPLLKAALVRRAMTDVTRIMRLREDKPALQILLQKGSIGDDLWSSLLAAEKELEAEILEVAAEANTFVEGWGTVIFQTATEMLHNEKMRSVLEQLPTMRADIEKKYAVKAKALPPPTPLPVSVPPNTPAPPPETPVSAASTNGLKSPLTAGVESVASTSDGEGSVAPSTPRTPKKSAKKGKKRK